LIELDGTYGEGGGALLRTAVTISAISQLPLRLTHVRGGTHHPGLDLEDELIVRSIGRACGAEIVGGAVGSQSLAFTPTRPIGPMTLKQEEGKGRGRGANSLVVLGTLLPILARSGTYSELDVIGESYGPNTLTYDYFVNVTLRAARAMGLHAVPTLKVAGFGRENFGDVRLEVEPSALRGLDWPNRGAIRTCKGLVTTAQLAPTVAARAESHLKRLSHFAGLPLRMDARDVPGSTPGAVISLWAEFENGMGGVAAVGARGVRIETVAQMAFDGLTTFIESGATADAYLADQLLLLAVVAEGKTSFTVPRLTQRLLTMIWVIRQFIPIHITVTGSEGTAGSVTIQP
jgi:RNA 3'-terminal phosphate cyclase (ATP)